MQLVRMQPIDDVGAHQRHESERLGAGRGVVDGDSPADFSGLDQSVEEQARIRDQFVLFHVDHEAQMIHRLTDRVHKVDGAGGQEGSRLHVEKDAHRRVQPGPHRRFVGAGRANPVKLAQASHRVDGAQ